MLLLMVLIIWNFIVWGIAILLSIHLIKRRFKLIKEDIEYKRYVKEYGNRAELSNPYYMPWIKISKEE